MERTLWFDELHDHLLDKQELHALELRAAKVYAANPHIFEDAREALRALGVVPLLEAIRDDREPVLDLATRGTCPFPHGGSRGERVVRQVPALASSY